MGEFKRLKIIEIICHVICLVWMFTFPFLYSFWLFIYEYIGIGNIFNFPDVKLSIFMACIGTVVCVIVPLAIGLECSYAKDKYKY